MSIIGTCLQVEYHAQHVIFYFRGKCLQCYIFCDEKDECSLVSNLQLKAMDCFSLIMKIEIINKLVDLFCVGWRELRSFYESKTHCINFISYLRVRHTISLEPTSQLFRHGIGKAFLINFAIYFSFNCI